MWAAANGHPEVVRELLSAKADLRARSTVYSQVVTSEVTQRAGREELNYTVRRGGSTPLLFAARSGDAESARLLLAAGADPNDALADGLPALTLAAYSGHGGRGCRAARTRRRSQRRRRRVHRAPCRGAAIATWPWCARCWRAAPTPTCR